MLPQRGVAHSYHQLVLKGIHPKGLGSCVMPPHERSFECAVAVGGIADLPVLTQQVSCHVAAPNHQVVLGVR
eukprot:2827714-Rhodomonas_salina.1